MGAEQFLHVVAGALIDDCDRVLIAQRPAGRHLAGGWEFPGGKLEAGEEPRAGLARELAEEIDIQVLDCRPLIRLRHRYPDRNVLLDVWLVGRYCGSPRALDSQQLRWCPRAELLAADLLEADRGVVTALRLPPLIADETAVYYRLIRFDELGSTGAPPAGQDARRMLGVICESAEQALAAAPAGANFCVLSAAMGPAELTLLCDRLNLPVFAAGMSLELAWQCGATGIYRAPGTRARPG